MIKITKEFFSENNITVSKAALIIGFLTLLSRFAGLIRSRLMASSFGAGDTLDVYYASFRLPDLIATFFVIGTLSVAFLPVFSELLIKDKKRAVSVANSVFFFTFVGMGILCGLFIMLTGPISHWLFPGFSPEKLKNTIDLTRILLLSQVIFAVSNIFSSMLNAYNKFFIAASAPLVYNLGIMIGVLYFYPVYGVSGLGFGVILGALMHLLIQFPTAYKNGYRISLKLNLKDLYLKKLLRLYFPRIFSFDMGQISLIVGSYIGSSLASGSITVLHLATDLFAVPVGVFALSTAVASYPTLSQKYAEKNENDFLQSLRKSTEQILFFMVPISIFMLLYRAYIVRLAFGSGQFGWDDTIVTFNILGILSFAIVTQSLTPLFSRAFFARHNGKTPLIINSIAIFIHAFISYKLATRFGVVGVAIGFVVSNLFSCLALFINLRSSFVSLESNLVSNLYDKPVLKTLTRIILASILSGAVGYICIYLLAPLFNTRTGIGILLQSGISGFFAVVTFIFTSYKLKLANSISIINSINKFRSLN